MAAQLAEATVRLGFTNVIDAFHVSRGGQPTQTRFFVDERASRQGITLTDHLLELANGGPITGVRDALSGYQDGRCAYCRTRSPTSEPAGWPSIM
jgi:hypothetical protein